MNSLRYIYTYSYHIRDATDLNKGKSKTRHDDGCYANLHSGLQIYRLAWEECEPKIWPDHNV